MVTLTKVSGIANIKVDIQWTLTIYTQQQKHPIRLAMLTTTATQLHMYSFPLRYYLHCYYVTVCCHISMYIGSEMQSIFIYKDKDKRTVKIFSLPYP